MVKPAQQIEAVPAADLPNPPRSAQAAADYIAAQSDRQRGADNGRPCSVPGRGKVEIAALYAAYSCAAAEQRSVRGQATSSRPGRVVKR